MISSLGAIAVAALYGIAILRMCGWRRTPGSWLVHAMLALAIGLGATSMLFFGAALLGVGRPLYIACEPFAVIALLLVVYSDEVTKFKRHLSSPSSFLKYRLPARSGRLLPRLSLLQWIGLSFFFLTAAGTLIIFVYRLLELPNGAWDGLAEWNLRSRYLAECVLQQKPFNRVLMGGPHARYPYLVSASAARISVYAGQYTVLGGMLVAGFFTFGTLTFLCVAAGEMAGAEQSIVAGLLLIGTPRWFETAAQQSADIPVGFFQLIALVLLVRSQREDRTGSNALVTGVIAGLAAWTKNEGLPLVAIILVVAIVFLRRSVPIGRWTAGFVAGCLPSVAAALAVKRGIPVPDPFGGLDRLFDLPRIFLIAKALAPYLMLLATAIVYSAVMGVSAKASRSVALRCCAAALVGIVGSWFAYYLVAPYDLSWQSANSADRLMMQFAPSLIFTLSLVVKTPTGMRLSDSSSSGDLVATNAE